jgi:site-specific DNA recombinase
MAARHGGQIIQLFKIAETASKREKRKTFRSLLEYTRRNARRLDGLLFVKVDRATRNLGDWHELETLEREYGVRLIFPDQPSGDTPTGRFQRRMSATMAAYQVEQQAVDIRAGHRRRVESGLPVSSAPFGYRNVRINGRGLVEIDPIDAPKVKRIFELYAYHPHTLDTLVDELARQGIVYKDRNPKFTRSTLNRMLNNKHYLGEVLYQGVWYGGKFDPLIERETFQVVQDRLGGKVYHHHEMTYAGSLITCDHCGHVVSGEKKIKKSPLGREKTYVYYRCAKYTTDGHPRVRATEAELEAQLLAIFDRM